jgi:hypothetical protein
VVPCLVSCSDSVPTLAHYPLPQSPPLYGDANTQLPLSMSLMAMLVMCTCMYVCVDVQPPRRLGRAAGSGGWFVAMRDGQRRKSEIDTLLRLRAALVARINRYVQFRRPVLV